MILTSSQLLTFIKRRLMLTTNQLGLSDQDILNEATLELQTTLVSDIESLQEGFLVYKETIPVAAGQEYVRLPGRALAQTITHIYWIDSSGGRAEIERLGQDSLEGLGTTASGAPTVFLVEANSIRFPMVPQVAGSIYVSYPFRPNALTSEIYCQQVTAVNAATKTVTLNNTAVFQNGQKYDVINNISGNEIIYYDLTGAINGNTIIFNQAIPNISVGNWISTAGLSPVPMVPEELHTYLVEITAARIAKERGMSQQYQEAIQGAQTLRAKLGMIMENRVTTKSFSLGGANPFLPWGS